MSDFTEKVFKKFLSRSHLIKQSKKTYDSMYS